MRHISRRWRYLSGACLLILLLPPSGWAGSSQQPPSSLKNLSLEQLGNLEVTTASKQPQEIWNTAAAIFVLTADDIRRSGATTIPQALRLVPGLDVARIDSDKWAIGIRGFQGHLSKSVLVLIDGRSVYTPLFAGVYWEVQDTLLEDVDRIEVIRGPGGTIWGANAVNGIINIITRDARQTRGAMLAAGGGSVDQGFLHARYGWGSDAAAYRAWGKWFTRGPQYHFNGHNFDDWRMGQGGMRADWSRGDDTFTIEGDAYDTLAGGDVALNFYSPPRQIIAEANGRFNGQNLVARWHRTLANGSNLRLQAYWDRTDRHDLNYHEIRNTFDVDFVHQLDLPRNQFLWGAGARISPSHYLQTSETVDFFPHRQTYNIFSGFLQDTFRAVPGRLSVIAGVKLEHNSFSGFEAQPSARLLWTPARHMTAWAAFTRAVRTPSRIEQGFTFDYLINPQLPLFLRLIGDNQFSPEELNGYEAGYRASVGDNVYFDISAFYNDYNDLLSVENRPIMPESTPTPPHFVLPLYFRNGVEGNTKGMEVAPTWEVVPGWRLAGSYSFVHINMRDKPWSDDASTVKQLEGDSPQHQVGWQSRLTLRRTFDFDVSYRYVSALPDQNVRAYSTADARLAWRPRSTLELSLVGQNLLQPHHPEYGGDPGGLVGIRRAVYGKITWRQ